jgi:Fur family ferric uptake transcriptional regulator
MRGHRTRLRVSGIIMFVRTVITNTHGGGGGRDPAGDAALDTVPHPFAGRRRSPAREFVAATAGRMPGALQVDELVDAVRSVRPDTGVATVYRAVAALADAGWLERVGERDGTALFARCGERCGARHHHHLVCTGCGAVVATECTVSDAVRAAADSAGFTVTAHDLRLYGLCGECGAGGADSREA